MTTHSASFDLQTFANGRWCTVDAFRTRAEAISKAQMLGMNPRHQAVRILHETYDPLTGRFSHRTIFRRSALDRDRIDAARADFAVARLLRNRNRKQGTLRGAAAAGPDGEWRLFCDFGTRVLAMITGGAFVLAIIERMMTF